MGSGHKLQCFCVEGQPVETPDARSKVAAQESTERFDGPPVEEATQKPSPTLFRAIIGFHRRLDLVAIGRCPGA
ncbi:hypothetical protein QE369_003583 [Agrobacterium larrymoorei]|uniref:Uncharacterized protein n=1 Tax=Agrobacterium larrymoorei TaxID=160699 RepID=A0AAJ2BI44_9HYPH|nr:hypothetical protein [Agrobacterium larrymoorei]